MSAALSAAAAARLARLEIELPSWGFADTGTRFGKFLQDAAALSIEDKLDDAAQVHRLTGACPQVAIHVLWDVCSGGGAGLAALARARGLRIGQSVQLCGFRAWGYLTPRSAAPEEPNG